MRPLHLKMTAFGPYREQENLDFSELHPHTLFVIAGPTGAGKTTIFDALSFALFGTGSGEDRQDTRMLRSDFAPDDVHTSVELTFQVRGRTIRIFRQMSHVKTGNKSATGEKYELVEVTSEGEVPLVERYTVTSINAKLMELVGMTADQFHQIVMLPQGEFRKFLTSSTDQKELILRKLFRTERFQKMNEYLKDKRQQLVEASQQHRAVLSSLMHQAAAIYPEELVFTQSEPNLYQVDAAFQSGSQQLQNAYAESKVEEEKAWTHYTEQQKVLQHMEWMAAKKARQQELVQKQQTLHSQQQMMTTVKSRIEGAIRAQAIAHIHDLAHKSSQTFTSKQHVIQQLETQVAQIKQDFQEIEQKWHVLQGQEQQRLDQRRQLERLQDLISQLTKQEQLRADEQRLSEQHQQKQKKLTEQKEEERRIDHKLQEFLELYQQLISESQALPEKKEAVNRLNEQLKQLVQLETKQQELVRLQASVEETGRRKQALEHELEAIHAEQANQLALQLAAHLHDGAPCPVCGSTEHPSPAAEHQASHSSSKVQVEKQLQEATSAHLRVTLEQERLTKEIDEFTSEHHSLIGKQDDLKAHLQTLDTEIKVLQEKKQQAESCREEGKAVRIQSNQLKEQLPALEQQVTRVSEEWQRLQGQLQALQQSGSDWTLERAREESTKQTRTLEHALSEWQTTDKRYVQMKEQYQSRVQQLEWERTQGEQLKKEAQEASEKWQQALASKDFRDQSEFQQAVMAEEQLNRLQQEVKDYEQALHQVTTELDLLARDLEGQEETIHVDEQRQLVDNMKQTWDAYKEQTQQFQGKIDATARLREQLDLLKEKMGDNEAKLATTTKLYDALRGQNNKKLSFERYMLIAYLEQITEAANQRLQSLSGGQFRLVRSDRQESHGKQSGLQLDVYDGYTGQFRDVKSLSGGEKFHASLSLALGMADVMQEMNGGIQIETMFIDEGFGSLDEESLQKAIDALVQLQRTGRLIGVISHVKELQAAIPAQLRVRKSSAGTSSTEFIIG